jgi:ABC-type Mn2+/Zn2+ transport system permease subunit
MIQAVIDWLVTPLGYTFMQRGMLAALIVGVLCSVIGCYVVLRSMAFLGDAMAHAVLPGVALAYLLGGNLLFGALGAAIVVALGIGFLSRRGALKEDTAIGILFTAALALGIAMISSIRSYAVDLSHILFGNVLGVSETDLWLTAGIAVVILGVMLLAYKPFMVISFDPVLAATLRLRVEFFRTLMLVLLAFTIVVSIQSVGVGLVAAMLVTPAATAFLLTRRLPSMMLVSAAVGAASSIVGLYASYYLNIASGAAVVLAATLCFLLAFLFAPQRGFVWEKLRRRPAAIQRRILVQEE